jgi:hypothetical protein
MHLLQTPQAKPPWTVELLGLSKQRLNPHAAFPHGFLICLRLAIRLGFIEVLLGVEIVSL